MKKWFSIFMTMLVLSFATTVFAEEEQVNLNWIEGPTTIMIGDELAAMNLPEGYVYLNKEDTITYNEQIGNYINGHEIGSIFSSNQDEYWFIIFEYYEDGHIEDTQGSDIDEDALLQSFKDGTEDQDVEAKKNGFPTSSVIGWYEKPFYDIHTNTLKWGMEFSSEGEKYVNYNSRILTRNGYVSAILVADTEEMDSLMLKAHFDNIINKFTLKSGNNYTDFDPKVDKVSSVGLAALIAGGAGVAAKTGILATVIVLLKKFGVAIIAVLAGSGSWLYRKFKRKNDDVGL